MSSGISFYIVGTYLSKTLVEIYHDWWMNGHKDGTHKNNLSCLLCLVLWEEVYDIYDILCVKIFIHQCNCFEKWSDILLGANVNFSS